MSLSTSATVLAVALTTAKSSTVGSRSKTMRSGVRNRSRLESHACTTTQFWLASHRRASRRSAVGCTTVPSSLATLTRPIQSGSESAKSCWTKPFWSMPRG